MEVQQQEEVNSHQSENIQNSQQQVRDEIQQESAIEESKVELQEAQLESNHIATEQEQNQSIDNQNQGQAKTRKNRELSYMQTSNIIENGGKDARANGQGVSFNGVTQIPMHQRIKHSMRSFMQRARQERSLDFRNVRRQSLDQMRIPQEIEYLFPNKVRICEQMRELEENMNGYMRQKLLSAKEDLLQSNLRAKRNLRLLVEVNPQSKLGLNSTEWKIRIEGRLISESEDDMLKCDSSVLDSKRFLNYFERINVSFNTGIEEFYPSVDWVKAKSDLGGAFDCFELSRSVNKEQKKKLGENAVIKVKLQFYLENSPRKYRLSPQLARILGGMEEATRIQIVGALWQYVKSNRLQDSDNRELINCNSDLAEVFGCGVGEEKLEFHQAVFRLKDHLYDLPPIELNLEVNLQEKNIELIIYELPVFEYGGGNHREQIEFLINCDYDFFTDKNELQNDQDLYLEDTLAVDKKSTTKLSQLNGAILKRREKKYNLKIAESINNMKRSYRHLHFYNKLATNPKTQIQNIIIEQNKWLRVMQEERPFFQIDEKDDEIDQAAFYQQNQSWLLHEVDNFLKKAKVDKKKEDESNNEEDDQSDPQSEDEEDME